MLLGALALVLVGALAVLVWLLNPSEVDADALAAVRADPDVRVSVEDGYVGLTPADGVGDEAVVFYPGAHAEALAYVPIWAPIVEDTGVAVFVPDMPLSLATLDADAAEGVLADHPGVERWWLGGHSLGGIAATEYAEEHPEAPVTGLVLWAAFPADGVDLSDRDLRVLTVTGSVDGIVPTAEVRRRLDRLPPGERSVVIAGMEHSQFGAYDSFFGAGDPGVSDEVARRRVARVTASFLSSG